MPRYVKTPYAVTHKITETETTTVVKVSVTPYNGWFQEKKEIIECSYAEELLKDSNIFYESCLNQNIIINNKKEETSTVEWIFSKPQPKKKEITEKVLDISPEHVIIDKEIENTVEFKSKRKKSRKQTKKTHKLL